MTLADDQACPMPVKPVRQLVSLTVPEVGKLLGQPTFHLSVGLAGELTSNAYRTRPPRRMGAYSQVLLPFAYAVIGPSMPYDFGAAPLVVTFGKLICGELL